MKRWRILSVCLALLIAAPAFASQMNKSSGLGLSRSGPNTARGTVTPTGGTFGDLLNKPANLSGGQSDFERLSDMPFKLPDIPADKAKIKGALSPANIGKALRGGIGGYVIGEAFKALADAACVRLAGGTMQATPSGAWEECVPGAPIPQSTGLEYTLGSSIPWSVNKLSVCTTYMQQIDAQRPEYTHELPFITSSGFCSWKVKTIYQPNVYQADYPPVAFQTRNAANCPAGWYITATGCQATKPETVQEYTPISTDQAQQKLEDAIKVPGNASKVWDAMRDYADKGGEFEIQPLAVEGPAQSPTSTSTTQSTQQTANGPQTLTTTNTTVINYNYNGDTITYNQTTTSVTKNEAGDVVSSTTTNSAPQPVDEPPTDTPLPPVPDLYVRKYPNGMEGIYDQYKDQLRNSSLVQLAAQLMPQVGDGGTCPSWPMNMNLATWAAYGVHDVAPPCWIWGVAKAILILSALLLARALIFGG